MGLFDGIWGRTTTVVKDRRTYSVPPELDQEGRYPLLQSFYDGRWLSGDLGATLRRQDPAVYKNTRLLHKQTNAIVGLYEQHVYAGSLSVDGEPASDGSRGAIPIDPQTSNETMDKALVKAVHKFWSINNWRQRMRLCAKYPAILGDVMAELIDDVEHGVVMVRFVWPGMISDLVLDDAGNVKQYALEYEVDIPASEGAFGVTRQAERYTYRKEVTGSHFYYYKNGQPHDYTEHNRKRIEPNPYGFVPAVWFRFEEMIDSNRGMGAFEKTLVSVMEINSLLSNAFDGVGRHLRSPVGVVDGDDASLNAFKNLTITLQNGLRLGTWSSDAESQVRQLRRAAAEQSDLLPMGPQGKFITVPFDLSGLKDVINTVLESMATENPETEYGKRLLEMTQATGPGVSRLLAPIVGLVESARGNLDPRMVALSQMGVAMMGFRVNLDEEKGGYKRELLEQRKSRYDVFRPFGLESWGKGDLDFVIADRPVFEDTPEERVAYLVLAESLTTEWAMLRAGIPKEEVDKILKEKEEARAAFADATLVDDTTDDEVQDDQQAEGNQPRNQRSRTQQQGVAA